MNTKQEYWKKVTVKQVKEMTLPELAHGFDLIHASSMPLLSHPAKQNLQLECNNHFPVSIELRV